MSLFSKTLNIQKEKKNAFKRIIKSSRKNRQKRFFGKNVTRFNFMFSKDSFIFFPTIRSKKGSLVKKNILNNKNQIKKFFK